MEIRGREIRWMCTVEAHHKIAALAEDNNINTVLNMLRNDSDHVQLYSTVALFCVAMSEGYEANRAWWEPGYTPNPLTIDEIRHLRQKELDAMFGEAFDAFMGDLGVTVETEEPKDGKKDEGGALN